MDKGFDGGDERAVPREPDRLMGPQAGGVETDGFTQGIVAATMRIAGEVVERLKLAKDSEICGGAQNVFEFGQSSDFVAQQVLAKDLGGEGEGSHNVIVPIPSTANSEL
jgi:hypothetical protein